MKYIGGLGGFICGSLSMLPFTLLPARSPPQVELAFNQDGGRDDWPEMDQSVDTPGDPWD